MPQQKELSEQVNSMMMIFTLNLNNSKREATSKVSLFIGSVLTGIATRGLFRKLCVKKHKQWASIEDVMAKAKRARRSEQQFFFFSSVLIQASSREVNFKDVLSYELAPIPTALFDDSGKTMV